MKKQILWGIALAALVAGANVCQAAGLVFTTIEPVASTNIIEWGEDGRENLEEAMNVHNLILEVRKLERLEQRQAITEQMRELEEKRLEALEKCSIDKLSEQFKNPKEVWDKMNAEYAQREKELTIYVNSSKEPTKEEREAFLNYLQTGKMSPEMIAEQYAPWRIGQEILTDVYQNQDKWGERKNAKAPSFPLWQDQKYVFDKEWNDYYVKLNTYFGVPVAGRPIVGDEKYDYARYEDVQKAHQAYLTTLAAKNPKKAPILAESLKNTPMPPRPLPPKNEAMLYFETDRADASVYPALPEPWQKYAENGFKDMDPKGEMASDFKKGFVLKEQAKNEPRSNRLTAYAMHKQSVDGMNALEGLSMVDGDSESDKVLFKLEKYVEISPDEDLLDSEVREKILAKLKAKKKELIAAAEKDLAARPDDKEEMISFTDMEEIDDFTELKKINPKVFERLNAHIPMSVYEQDENIIKALKKDTEGRVYINEVNAGDIDKMLAEEKARKAFFDGRNELEKMVAAGASLKIDETCLNGGV